MIRKAELKTPQEKLKEKIYRVNVSLDIPREKKAFNIKDFRKKAAEVRRTFRKDESPIRFDPSF